MTGAKTASNTIIRIIKSDTKAPLFFVNRLHESCKKLREGAAIFSRSALGVKSTRWNNSFSVNSAITLPLLHQKYEYEDQSIRIASLQLKSQIRVMQSKALLLP